MQSAFRARKDNHVLDAHKGVLSVRKLTNKAKKKAAKKDKHQTVRLHGVSRLLTRAQARSVVRQRKRGAPESRHRPKKRSS